MSFDYDKLKNKEESNSYWASYSDLFMVLSLVFLLLYVFSSLRTSTFSIQQQMEFQLLSERNQDLEQQIKVYNTIKEDYLEKQELKEQKKVYDQLMSKLDLLKDETNQEQEELVKKLGDAKERKLALNKYQQLVRNMINSNLLAKSKLDLKSRQIQSQSEDIEELTQLQKEIQEKLNKAKSDLSETEKQAAQEKRKKEQLAAELKQVEEENKEKLASLKKQNEEQIQSLQAQYEAEKMVKEQDYITELKKQKLSAKQREKKLEEYRAKEKKKFQAQLAGAKKELKQKVKQLSQEIQNTEGELAKAKERLDARKKLAKEISKNFKKKGIKAEVDKETGDVVLSFGDEYFDTGKHSLKKAMKSILKKSMPVYASSLFSDKKIASKLSHVEIVGFASPTYQGKYVDPASLDDETRKAVNYNLDLSYYRARNIFNYIFDTKKLSFKEQKKLRKLVKVTGRSFLASDIDREISSEMSQKEFCKKYDCKKAQKVIIKFDIKD